MGLGNSVIHIASYVTFGINGNVLNELTTAINSITSLDVI